MNTRQQGMSLIELMIVVAIVAILAAIAYPSYRDQIRRSNRTDAKVALQRVAQGLEKCFTRYMTYEGLSAAQCPTAAQAVGQFQTEGGRYRIAATIPRPDAPAGASSYLLTATPLGVQATDAKCMEFSLNETGLKAVSGSDKATPANCW